jgi:hypothetical protein
MLSLVHLLFTGSFEAKNQAFSPQNRSQIPVALNRSETSHPYFPAGRGATLRRSRSDSLNPRKPDDA